MKSPGQSTPTAPCGGRNQKRDVHCFRIECMRQARDVGSRAFDPEGVGVAEKERLLSEERQGALDAAALVEERGALVGDENSRRAARGEMRLDLIGVPVDVDDCAFDAVLGQPIEAMIDQGPAADLDQRLRQHVRDRAHARAQTRSEHHGGLGNGRAHRRSLRGSCGAGSSGGGPSARGRWV